MGLFNLFKKKEPAPAPNTTSSVYTLRFGIPFFSVFDKTNPKLKAFPVKISVGGSLQYRILDLDLCFDNVPLGKMKPEQLEAYVKDQLVSSVKHFINTIDYLPVMQFESEIMAISDAAKDYLVHRFADEFGISIRTFTITRISYDEDDPNYQRLYEANAALAEKMGEQDLEDQDLDHEHGKRVRAYKEEDELHNLERRKKLRDLEDDEEYEALAHKKHLRDMDRENEAKDHQHEYEHQSRLRDIQEENEYASQTHKNRLQEMDREDEISEHEHDRHKRDVEKEEELLEREQSIDSRRRTHELDERRKETQLENEQEDSKIALERKRRELEEDMHARRQATDSGATLAKKLSERSAPKLGQGAKPSLHPKPTKDDDLDLGSL